MANLYRQQQVSDLAHKVYSAEGNPAQNVIQYGEQMQKQAQQYEDKAKVTYANALEIESANVMNELLNDPSLSANPVLLEEKMNDTFDKMAGDIVDEDVKLDFLAKTSVKKSSYLNKAYANAKKVQDEQLKSSLFDDTYANIEALGLATENGVFLGLTSEDEVINAVMADDKVRSNIYYKNDDGTYVFSDEQRARMEKDRNDALVLSFKKSYINSPKEEKERISRWLDEDYLHFGFDVSKDGSLGVQNNFKNVLPAKEYQTLKEWVSKQNEVENQIEYKQMQELEKAEKVATFNLELDLSSKLDSLNPSEALRVLEENENNVSSNFYKAKEESILSSKGITAQTRDDTAREIALSIEGLNKYSDDVGLDFLAKADEILTNIEKKYAYGELSQKDRSRLVHQMMKGVSRELPNLETEWLTFGYEYADAYEDIRNNLTDITKADALFMEYFREREKGDYSGEQKKNLAIAMIKKANDREFNVKIFKNNDELKEAIQNGFVSNGETVYVGGERGTVGF